MIFWWSMIETKSKQVKVMLVGLDTGVDPDFERSMDELKSLSEAACKEVVGIITQKAPEINKTWYIGSGKVFEVKEFLAECEADEIIFDDTLTPAQLRNLTKKLDCLVSDRTKLILDIFALRAKTKEAKLQVETARLQYMLPRLVGMHEALSRQGGTSGSMSNKGTGETQLELDRRRIEHRISELKRELDNITKIRENQRKKRDDSRIPRVSLVGYTNAGKSTVLNHIVNRYSDGETKTVFEKDMLFATLETSVRRIDTKDNRPFFLADTVGFIHKLPHSLVKAFRSTLMEVLYADLLVHVVDFSDEFYKEQMTVTQETLKELGACDIPQIVVYNKADKCNLPDIPKISQDHIYMSASNDIGIDELVKLIQNKAYMGREVKEFLFPYNNGNKASALMNSGDVIEMEYRDDGIWMKVNCDSHDTAKYGIFILK